MRILMLLALIWRVCVSEYLLQIQARNGAKQFTNRDTAAGILTRPGSSSFDTSAFSLLGGGIFIYDWALDMDMFVSTTGTVAMAGKLNFGADTLTKYVDQYSPSLFNYIATGTSLTATLAWVTTSQTTGDVVLKTVYYFNSVYLTSLSHAMDDQQPVEKLSFEYGSDDWVLECDKQSPLHDA